MKTIDRTLAGGHGDTLADRMAAARSHAGLTQKQASEGIGLSAKQIGRIEHGAVQMVSDPATLVRAAKTYGVSDVWLYAGGHAGPRLVPDWYRHRG